MILMNTKQVKDLTGLTDDQISYLIKKVDALKREKTQGKARKYSFRDLVYLKLASVMRSDGMGLPAINDSIAEIDKNWTNSERPLDAGVLTILPPAKKKASRSDPSEIYLNSAYSIIKENHQDEIDLPEIRPMLILFSKSKWFIKDDDAEFSKYSNHLPGVIYNVGAIAEELSKVYQVELDLMSEVEAVN